MPVHPAAREWVARWATADPVTVLDVGGRNINGSSRDLYPHAHYVSLDLHPGPGVDVVADAAIWVPDRLYDIVVCTEVFEHTEAWPQLCMTAFKACGQLFIATMAGPGRKQHSGVDGAALQPGEWYENIDPDMLERVLYETGFATVTVDVAGLDVRAVAEK
jgi:hypothetical protein